MNMQGMYKEDAENKSLLEGAVAVHKLVEEADVVLEGKADNPNQDYEVTKPEAGFIEKEGDTPLKMVANPYQFASEHDNTKVLVIHGDGTFSRYNHIANA